MSENRVKATIFIPTFNGDAYLKDILNGLFRQNVDFTYEVLIIDSGSTDKTLAIINKFQKKYRNLRLHEIPNSEFGHGKTRNLAAQMAKGEIVVYLSHDAIPAHKRWLYEMIIPFDLNPKIMGVMGKQIPRPRCIPLLKYEIQHVFSRLGPDYGTTIFYKDDFVKSNTVRDAIAFYSDVNSATRRSFLLNTIPYRDVKYSEDQFFGRDIIEAGYYKVYAPRGSVVHSNDLSLKEYKKRMFDETLALRKAGIWKMKVSRPRIAIAIFRGVISNSIGITRDNYTWKRKLYWLAVNPIYHVEKWKGIQHAFKIGLKDADGQNHHSLEYEKSGRLSS